QFLSQPSEEVIHQLSADIADGTSKLVKYVAAADGLQCSAQENTTVHHFANVLFNIMRGGIFANGSQVNRTDLLEFVQTRNQAVLHSHQAWFNALPESLEIGELVKKASGTEIPDIVRLCYEYLPLTFSRRHGDPSRPWNYFSINLKKEDGSPNLDYQGNWRDIFQNWEPLALSFPNYAVSLIAKFLNATTADGYNPYRVTRSGIEWEVPEPENPWANIGYWSDHQIIYLQKLLEVANQVNPQELSELWNRPIFAYADVPYRIRDFSSLRNDPNNSIDFDWEREQEVKAAVSKMGTDGRLLKDDQGQIIHGTMVEKLLVLLLAKLSNLVPEGGIWMNTQRPEWNDANNALVGNGLSVVTVGYMRRFIVFWKDQLDGLEASFSINTAVADLFSQISDVFAKYESHLDTGFTNQTRESVMFDFGGPADAYRTSIYRDGIPKSQLLLEADQLRRFLSMALRYIDQTLQANMRSDHLAHSYNIWHPANKGIEVENLYLMLEGQVSLLSSGILSPDKAVVLLKDMRHSVLYRADQHSYMLYPNRRLDNFQEKNNISPDRVSGSALISALIAAKDSSLIAQDAAGIYHFNGRFRNKNDVQDALNLLSMKGDIQQLVAAEQDFILNLFEEVFNHRAFTGRSGTFFAYEGLGSIYWHMVSKLLLTVQEYYQRSIDESCNASIVEALAEIYYDVRAGIGFNKSPDVYGAFPTDPYSHTPMGGGARQPGMTGQVKEEILTRWGELGVQIKDGQLSFSPTLLRLDEFLLDEADFQYVDSSGIDQTVSLGPDSLAFTFCQTPIVYLRGAKPKIETVLADGRSIISDGKTLDKETTQHIFDRNGHVKRLCVTVPI
ncbi:MAG: hypothetical protein AAGD96_16555, partial [Chloroflexota bacterium]